MDRFLYDNGLRHERVNFFLLLFLIIIFCIFTRTVFANSIFTDYNRVLYYISH